MTSASLAGPKRILVRSPNWIGDQVLAYPFFYWLRRTYPHARITAACVSWVKSVQFMDCVDEVLVLPRAKGKGFLSRVSALQEGAEELRSAGPWDIGITLPNSFSAAWELWRSGARVRRGYVMDGRGFLLTDKLPPLRSDVKSHRSDIYAGLLPEPGVADREASEFWGLPPEAKIAVENVGILADPGDIGVPGVVEKFDAARAWPDAEAVDPPVPHYWVLAPGSAAETRRWPVDRFCELARIIAKETGLIGLVVGGVAEIPLAERLCSDDTLKLVDMTAIGSPASLWKIFRGARFTVSNDSGLAHIASLCGSKVQVVWGAGDTQVTRPIGPGKARVIFNPADCWPCESNHCDRPTGRKLECLLGIGPDAVWRELEGV